MEKSIYRLVAFGVILCYNSDTKETKQEIMTKATLLPAMTLRSVYCSVKLLKGKVIDLLKKYEKTNLDYRWRNCGLSALKPSFHPLTAPEEHIQHLLTKINDQGSYFWAQTSVVATSLTHFSFSRHTQKQIPILFLAAF